MFQAYLENCRYVEPVHRIGLAIGILVLLGGSADLVFSNAAVSDAIRWAKRTRCTRGNICRERAFILFTSGIGGKDAGMSDTQECLANSLGLKHGDDYESVKQYDQTRFRSARMSRLDAREKEFARFAFDLVGPEAAILDVPCGNGRFYEVFSPARQLTMADYSENMLKACREKHNPGENVRLIRSDIAALPLPDSSVDLVFCMRLFHHMTTDAIRLASLHEVARVSRKYVALSFYNCRSWRYIRKRLLRKKIRHGSISARHFSALAEGIGLLPVHRFPRLNLVEQQCMMIFEKR